MLQSFKADQAALNQTFSTHTSNAFTWPLVSWLWFFVCAWKHHISTSWTNKSLSWFEENRFCYLEKREQDTVAQIRLKPDIGLRRDGLRRNKHSIYIYLGYALLVYYIGNKVKRGRESPELFVMPPPQKFKKTKYHDRKFLAEITQNP